MSTLPVRKVVAYDLEGGIQVRSMTRYSKDFKQIVIDKILSNESTSMRSVAKEYDIPIATVSNWIQKTDVGTAMDENQKQIISSKMEFSSEDKFKIIIETASLATEELSAYCRNKGIYSHDIEAWKQEMVENLNTRNNKLLFAENRNLKIKLRELQSELRCKEKALAETSALLLLKKKAKIIWEDQEEEKSL